MLGNLTIDKASMNISCFLYSVKIIHELSGRATRKEFVKTMAEFIGLPYQKNGKENRTPYNKSKLPRYFGFIDLAKDADGGTILVLTQRGAKLVDIISERPNFHGSEDQYYIKPEDQAVFTNMFLESVLFDTFGKNNCGAEQSNTDVEPPKVVFKTLSLLERATAAEIVYIMFSLNRGFHKTYDEALNAVKEKRSVGQYDYSPILEEWGLINIANDCKIINIFTDDSIRLITSERDEEIGKTFYRLNPTTTQHYRKEIENLSPVYAPLQMTVHTTNMDAAVQWVNETILGRVSNLGCVTTYTYDPNAASDSFISTVLIPAVAKAFNNEKTNHYLIVKNADTERVAMLFGRLASLLNREHDFTSIDNGFSSVAVSDEVAFSQLVTLSGVAKALLRKPGVLLPPNFHIVSIESETVNMSREYDYTFKQCLVDTGTESVSEDTDQQKILPVLPPRSRKRFPLNSILYGAPGTGKTYSTAQYALAIAENTDIAEIIKENRASVMKRYNALVTEGRIVFTTFHQNYGYEDFIQGIRPDTSAGNMAFKTVDGVFKTIVDRAMAHSGQDYIIIIDEINRANISKVFGELITLIEDDKRWGEINAIDAVLPSGEIFAVPNNLYILGTMNSADKSISLIDTALRRRFDFFEYEPDASLVADADLRLILTRLNSGISSDLGSTDLLIGHSYFMHKTIDDLCTIMNRHIIPLLYEYFFDNQKKVEAQIKAAVNGYPVELKSGTVGRIKLVKKGAE